jgi:hypothetical protein
MKKESFGFLATEITSDLANSFYSWAITSRVVGKQEVIPFFPAA